VYAGLYGVLNKAEGVVGDALAMERELLSSHP
jgi:hypothetical protein